MNGLKTNIYFLILGIAFTSLASGEARWQAHSAYMIQPKKWEIGLYQPFRYGYSKSLEASVHPLLFFVIPNVSFKMKMEDFNSSKVANRTTFIYPTPLLNMVARKGIGGLIDPNIIMPPMLGVSTSLLMSKELVGFGFTSKIGVDIGITFGELDSRSNIDLPIIYHRLEVFHNKWGIHTGFDITKAITKKINMLIDIDLRYLPSLIKVKEERSYSMRLGDHSIEHKFLLIWYASKNLRIMTGYKLVNGDYPYGAETRILPYVPMLESWAPIIEFQWSK